MLWHGFLVTQADHDFRDEVISIRLNQPRHGSVGASVYFIMQEHVLTAYGGTNITFTIACYKFHGIIM